MANIKTHLDKIKNALFGQEVRGSIHDGIDAINKEVEGTTEKQNKLGEQFKNLVINEGNSNAEVAASRGSHDWLPDRLDNFDSQLEQIAVNPLLFGAIGDGVTDDTEAIIRTISFLKSNGGGTLLISKNHRVKYNKIELCDNLIIKSNNKSEIISYTNNFNDVIEENIDNYKHYHIFKGCNLNNITIEGLVLNQTNDDISSVIIQGDKLTKALHLENINNLKVKDCKFLTNSVNTIYIKSSTPVNDWDNVHKTTIVDNEIIFSRNNSTDWYDATPIYVTGMVVSIINNTLLCEKDYQKFRCDTGIEVQAYSSLIENNTIKGFVNGMIHDGTSPYHYTPYQGDTIGFNITNNNILDVRSGILFFPSAGDLNKNINGSRGTISNNNIVLNSDYQDKYVVGQYELSAKFGIGMWESGYDTSCSSDITIENNNINHITNFAYEYVHEHSKKTQCGIYLYGNSPVDNIRIYNNSVNNLINGIGSNCLSTNKSNKNIIIENNILRDVLNVFLVGHTENIKINKNTIINTSINVEYILRTFINNKNIIFTNNNFINEETHLYDNYSVKYDDLDNLKIALINHDVLCWRDIKNINHRNLTFENDNYNVNINLYPNDTIEVYNGYIHKVMCASHHNTKEVYAYSTYISKNVSGLTGDYSKISIGDIYSLNSKINVVTGVYNNRIHWLYPIDNHSNIELVKPIDSKLTTLYNLEKSLNKENKNVNTNYFYNVSKLNKTLLGDYKLNIIIQHSTNKYQILEIELSSLIDNINFTAKTKAFTEKIVSSVRLAYNNDNYFIELKTNKDSNINKMSMKLNQNILYVNYDCKLCFESTVATNEYQSIEV